MMKIFLGVDGGGTSTRAVLVTNTGQLLGIGLSGPSNYDDVGIELTRENLRLAVHAAWEQASLPVQPTATAFLGMAGVVSAADREAICQIAIQLNLAPSDQIWVDHDIRILLAGGLLARPGIALVVGTGSACYGRGPDGSECRVGGWGYLLDDVGSGYYLGLEAIKGIARNADGRISLPTSLAQVILSALQIDYPQNIMRRLYHDKLSRAEIASLAPLVLNSAIEGDTLAQKIVADGQAELVLLVTVACKRLKFRPHTTKLVISGGLVKYSSFYREALYTAIHLALPGIQIQEPALPPVLGAAVLAIQSSGVRPARGAIRKLQHAAQRACI